MENEKKLLDSAGVARLWGKVKELVKKNKAKQPLKYILGKAMPMYVTRNVYIMPCTIIWMKIEAGVKYNISIYTNWKDSNSFVLETDEDGNYRSPYFAGIKRDENGVIMDTRNDGDQCTIKMIPSKVNFEKLEILIKKTNNVDMMCVGLRGRPIDCICKGHFGYYVKNYSEGSDGTRNVEITCLPVNNHFQADNNRYIDDNGLVKRGLSMMDYSCFFYFNNGGDAAFSLDRYPFYRVWIRANTKHYLTKTDRKAKMKAKVREWRPIRMTALKKKDGKISWQTCE